MNGKCITLVYIILELLCKDNKLLKIKLLLFKYKPPQSQFRICNLEKTYIPLHPSLPQGSLNPMQYLKCRYY